ncbi:hypothetical protein [Pseudomonas nicosulfuronedens]
MAISIHIKEDRDWHVGVNLPLAGEEGMAGGSAKRKKQNPGRGRGFAVPPSPEGLIEPVPY